jgi:hypothetical protein
MRPTKERSAQHTVRRNQLRAHPRHWRGTRPDPDASFGAGHVAQHGANVPMGRLGQANEVAPCHLFLACADFLLRRIYR